MTLKSKSSTVLLIMGTLLCISGAILSINPFLIPKGYLAMVSILELGILTIAFLGVTGLSSIALAFLGMGAMKNKLPGARLLTACCLANLFFIMIFLVTPKIPFDPSNPWQYVWMHTLIPFLAGFGLGAPLSQFIFEQFPND